MGARPGDFGQSRESHLPGRVLRSRRGQSQGEQGRLLSGRPRGRADLDDLGDGPLPIGGEAPLHGTGVLECQRLARHVVRPGIRAEHKKPLKPGPVVDRKGIATGVVRDLAGKRLGLRCGSVPGAS